VRAARAFSYDAQRRDSKPTLLGIEAEIKVAYRTVLRMRDVIERVARKVPGTQACLRRVASEPDGSPERDR
jgi:hypothetical protein